MSDLIKSFKADGEIAPNLIVEVTATGVAVAGTATDSLIGVSYPEVTSDAGEQADVVMAGICEVKAGGSLAIGNFVTADANGKAVATTTKGDFVIGRVLEAAASADEIVKISLTAFTHA